MDVFKLTLIRHGETPENELKIIQGHKDTNLSEKGIRQVKLLAQRLENESFSHVYSSDLSRARQTCEIIMLQNKKSQVQIKTDVRLRERKLGILEGQPLSSCRGLYKVDSTQSLTGMESKQQLRQHAKSFFKDLCSVMQQHRREILEQRGLSGEDGASSEESKNVSGSHSLPPHSEAFLDPNNSQGTGELVEFHTKPCVTQELNDYCGNITSTGDCSEEPRALHAVGTRGHELSTDAFGNTHSNIYGITNSVTYNSNVSSGASASESRNILELETNKHLRNISAADLESNTGFAGAKSDLPTYNIFANALIVSHGGLLMELIAYFVKELKCKIPESQRTARNAIPNAGISRFVIGINEGSKVVPKVACLSLFETDHLVGEGEDLLPLMSSADCI